MAYDVSKKQRDFDFHIKCASHISPSYHRAPTNAKASR